MWNQVSVHGLRPYVTSTLVLLLWVLPALPAAASSYWELRAAQDHLLAASDYLRALPADRLGRGQRALQYVNQALQEIQSELAGQTAPGSREQRMQQRDEDLERKRQKREQQLENKRLQREEQLESR
jgi:hypothetical protein